MVKKTEAVLVPTGECNYRDEVGNIWCATSYLDESTGEVTTQDVLIEPAIPVE